MTHGGFETQCCVDPKQCGVIKLHDNKAICLLVVVVEGLHSLLVLAVHPALFAETQSETVSISLLLPPSGRWFERRVVHKTQVMPSQHLELFSNRVPKTINL